MKTVRVVNRSVVWQVSTEIEDKRVGLEGYSSLSSWAYADLTPIQARKLGRALLKAADEVDGRQS